MKQTDPVQLEKAQEVMDELREIRGGELLPFHRKMANDPQLLDSFKKVFLACNKGDNVIPKKYRELMIMILGCARGVETTILVHGNNAIKAGATVQEVGEALRIVLMLCGATGIIPAAGLFEELEDKNA